MLKLKAVLPTVLSEFQWEVPACFLKNSSIYLGRWGYGMETRAFWGRGGGPEPLHCVPTGKVHFPCCSQLKETETCLRVVVFFFLSCLEIVWSFSPRMKFLLPILNYGHPKLQMVNSCTTCRNIAPKEEHFCAGGIELSKWRSSQTTPGDGWRPSAFPTCSLWFCFRSYKRSLRQLMPEFPGLGFRISEVGANWLMTS